jgi:hypothetical protein
MDKKQKIKNLEKIVEKLDITNTMRENAENKYKSLTSILENNGLKANIYPQGSFAIGTVVRPYANGNDLEYDLDFVCVVDMEKKKTLPKIVREKIKSILDNTEKNVEYQENCFVVKYKQDNQDIVFKMDIVPTVLEDEATKQKLILGGLSAQYAQEPLAIAKAENEWGFSNPKGYTDWFNDINVPYLKYKEQETKIIKDSIQFNVEEIPNIPFKSNMQIVIQILKRHRDIYYDIINKGRNNDNRVDKPSSAIITTLIAQICKNALPGKDLYELLEYVLKELSTYTKLQNISNEQFLFENQNKVTIKKVGIQWEILNPVHPGNNLAATWNNEIAKTFFMWLDSAKDLVLAFEYDEERYKMVFSNSFGDKLTEEVIGKKTDKRTNPVIIANTKPYKK